MDSGRETTIADNNDTWGNHVTVEDLANGAAAAESMVNIADVLYGDSAGAFALSLPAATAASILFLAMWSQLNAFLLEQEFRPTNQL